MLEFGRVEPKDAKTFMKQQKSAAQRPSADEVL